jgi:iron(III) transport system substrate-binding protein
MLRAALLSLLVLSGFALGEGNAQTPSGKLILYTSQPQADATATIAAFRKSVPGVEVEFVRDGTTQIMARLRAEIAAGNPQPDLLLIADAMSMETLKAEGRLMPYPEAAVAALPDGAVDAERTYFATKFITTGIIYNTRAARPTSWADLLKAEAKGQVVMPSPLVSGAAAIHMGTLASVPGIGLDFYRKLSEAGAVAVQGNGQVRTQVAGGQKMYGVIVDFMALNAKKEGSPVDFVFPTDGVSVVTEPVAILRTAKNPAAARAFVDWVLSSDGQGFAASQGYMPVRADVKPPETFPGRESVKVLAPPIADILRDDAKNKRLFTDLFGG